MADYNYLTDTKTWWISADMPGMLSRSACFANYYREDREAEGIPGGSTPVVDLRNYQPSVETIYCGIGAHAIQ